MCVRMYLVDTNEMEKQFNMAGISDLVRFRLDHQVNVGGNLSTEQSQVIIRNGENNENIIELATWGLIPSFSKEISSVYNMANTRIESCIEKPYFKRLTHHHRCIIPVNGYYEWSGEKGSKTPHAIYSKKLKTLYLAGLWDLWASANGDEVLSFSIITKPADNSISKIHSRMPVVMTVDNAKAWLDTKMDSKDVDNLVLKINEELSWASSVQGINLDSVVVDKSMNSPKNVEFKIMDYVK
jgi:putative SOS response-associated peptidase YedK